MLSVSSDVYNLFIMGVLLIWVRMGSSEIAGIRRDFPHK